MEEGIEARMRNVLLKPLPPWDEMETFVSWGRLRERRMAGSSLVEFGGRV